MINHTAPDFIGITTGDTDGVGLEVSLKALKEIGPYQGYRFVLFHNEPRLKKSEYLKEFYLKKFDPETSQKNFGEKNTLFEVQSELAAHQWVELSAKMALKNQLQGLVSAPMSKVIRSGRLCGHTEILKEVSQVENVRMAFVGHQLNLILHTAHIPLCEVSKCLCRNSLRETIQGALRLRESLFDESSKRLPIGVLGLNPHAGENGKIGEEESILEAVVQEYRDEGHSIEGPLVPDVAFQKTQRSQFSVIMALYHDQGLIPFKMLHTQEGGAQVTLGLPFVRTSVDHGTAKDLFGKNQANPGSMRDAIRLCIRQISQKNLDLRRK